MFRTNRDMVIGIVAGNTLIKFNQKTKEEEFNENIYQLHSNQLEEEGLIKYLQRYGWSISRLCSYFTKVEHTMIPITAIVIE